MLTMLPARAIAIAGAASGTGVQNPTREQLPGDYLNHPQVRRSGARRRHSTPGPDTAPPAINGPGIPGSTTADPPRQPADPATSTRTMDSPRQASYIPPDRPAWRWRRPLLLPAGAKVWRSLGRDAVRLVHCHPPSQDHRGRLSQCSRPFPWSASALDSIIEIRIKPFLFFQFPKRKRIRIYPLPSVTNMDNRDFTMHPLALMPQTQGIPDPGSFFDFDSEYTEGNGAYHPAPPEPFGQVTSLASTGGGSDGGQARESSAKSRAERKSHTKSRRGCYNCKRRRIKVRAPHPSPHMALWALTRPRPVLRDHTGVQQLRKARHPLRISWFPYDCPPGNPPTHLHIQVSLAASC